MGIGFAEGISKSSLWCIRTDMWKDLLVCIALGVDMVGSKLLSYHADQFIRTYIQADCVFPTRTARFGVALTPKGPLNLSTYLSFRWSSIFLTFP